MAPKIDDNLFKHLILGVKDYAIFALDTSGNVASWNPGAERIKGYNSEEIIGKHFSIFYEEETVKRKHPEFELTEAVANGSYEEQGNRVRKSGELFYAHVTITALYDETGKHIGFAKITRDLTEKRTFENANKVVSAELEKSNVSFGTMIAAVKDYAIFSLSREGYIQTWNEGAERIKGYTADEIIGKHFSIFYTQESLDRNHPQYELEQAIKNGSYEEEGWRVRKDRTQIWASVTISAIMTANGELKGFTKVTRDLTERKNYEEQLKQARDAAILANAMKTRFMANVSHEIRTPLGGVIGLSQLLAEDTDLDELTQDSARRIFEASKQLLDILNDLLDFAKLEAGKMDIENIPYSAAKVVDEVFGLAQPKARHKNLKLTTAIDAKIPDFNVGDPSKVRQVLNNLINNAIKFTEEGSVEVSVNQQNDSLKFAVIDTGIGISPATQVRLFQPFVQADESTTRLFGGTGLGLSIAQQLTERMGGKIGLTSEPDVGTTVWFTVPLKQIEELKSEA